MAAELDLKQLALDREPNRSSSRGSRRPFVSRYLLPTFILGGFLAMLGWAVRDRFIPSKPVMVLPVVVTRAEVQQAGTPLFQAAGWIEPRPTPVLASALVEGIMQELLVVEGERVIVGQPLAKLINTDARLALQQAQAAAVLTMAEVATAQAELRAARLRR